jgi:hypothetical protein
MQSPNSPYISVWFQPKKTVEKILNNEIEFTHQIPIILVGFAVFIGQLNDPKRLGFIFPYLVMVFGIVFMYLFLAQLMPWLLIKAGKLWNGTADFKQMQKVVALAQVPIVVIVIYQLIFLMFGQIVDFDDVNYALLFIQWVFSIRILLVGIAKVQNFSYGFALLNFVFSILPFIILRLLIG